ncbi:hypothetical protein Ava_A0012 (plasmid) [Trichormus variabilis ATCC 29413]|uniref:Uncharacterized protein n=3 Tax=Anabaena variabilis TaxID=264691 RepID=Q3M1R6_TRIV2|nr:MULTISPECIES: hypothetical protein [Nostocaceae]ABA25070.1 hypothetical protein Ava_A0012 [Trichormus variabilis ATCC 29413]MBC1218132.1 hypothetical protein [Trichormus variabilis ARAD]MBC1259398.1 hypothetical protein [Trichormus variabilis V5]MBC1270905.1 hypothetical protein [Trichormus variabilis FSR]MBC1305825.1 hypothetical protein [Trichormus variabilis N2B]
MNPATIEIHEFSTGIRPEKTADNGWVSRGFTGQYMNMTLPSVPSPVERSIANREFAVTEGASSDQPAIIGRVVGSGENVWSVVAVVTRGRDEIGRSLSVYRYFLCQGDKENLRLILAWWERQGMPKFNPFDSKTVRQPNLFDVNSVPPPNISQEARDLPMDSSDPILLTPTHQYNLQTINILAIRKFNTHSNGQPASWAFNVEALEQPRRFQVIQAASQRAYEILNRAIKNFPQFSAPVIADEEALKSAIRSLINSSQVKPEAIQAIIEALQNQQISKEYWHSLFDGQGAQTAYNQKIYSPQMVKLITLRAMVIPETITEFLAWLNVKHPKDKPDENQIVSLDFQASVRSKFPKEKLADGIKYILPKLLKQTIKPESVYWLFSNNSAWVSCRKQFIEDTVNDLNVIKEHFLNTQGKSTFPNELLKCDSENWKKLISYWKMVYSGKSYVEYYQPFAELFEYIKEYYLSAYFYQVSRGLVPKDIFDKVAQKNNIRSNSMTVLDLRLEREVTWFESLLNFILQEFIVPIQIVIPLSIFIFIGGLFVGSRFLAPEQSTVKQPIFKESSTISGNQGDRDIPEFNKNGQIKSNTSVSGSDIPLELNNKKTPTATLKSLDLNKGLQKFNTTSKVIQKIVSELANELNRDPQEIQTALKFILKDTQLDYAGAIDQERNGTDLVKEQKRWVRAIYKYQEGIDPSNAYGIMTDPENQSGGKTYKDLKQDIKKYFNPDYQGENPPRIR